MGIVVRNLVAERRRSPADRARAIGGDVDDRGIEDADGEPLPDASAEAAFEASLLPVLLDLVRREFSPQLYQAFELTALCDVSGAEAAALTGLSRGGVSKARARIIARLRELGAPYREDGRLGQRLRQALEAVPEPDVEASLSTRVERCLSRRQEAGP